MGFICRLCNISVCHSHVCIVRILSLLLFYFYNYVYLQYIYFYFCVRGGIPEGLKGSVCVLLPPSVLKCGASCVTKPQETIQSTSVPHWNHLWCRSCSEKKLLPSFWCCGATVTEGGACLEAAPTTVRKNHTELHLILNVFFGTKLPNPRIKCDVSSQPSN